MLKNIHVALTMALTMVVAPPAHAETVSVAVAANFTAVAEQLADAFTARTGDTVTLSFGASGTLYTQISQGAPFDLFLSADAARPAKAVAEGLGVADSVFTYAMGALALYSTSIDVHAGKATLSEPFDKLAIANPLAAPYGQAAVETLKALDLYAALAPKLVTGENITQTLQFVASGNAELGFVAASQVVGKGNVWIVPAALHSPIRQDAVLLNRGVGNSAAVGFITFLKSDAAAVVIEAAGYSLDRGDPA